MPQSVLGHGSLHTTAGPPTRFQDVVGQFPQLKTYNHACAVFRLADDVTQDTVIATLKGGLEKLISKVPWLGEQVVHEGQEKGNSGVIKTVPLPQGTSVDKLIRVKDCTDICPSYEEIVVKGGPATMLDGNVLCPFPGYPFGYDVAKIGFAPVVVIQANFIKGGVILNFSNQHNVMDTSGMFVFIALLTTLLQGKELPQTYIDQANLDRAKVIPLLDPGQPIRDHSHLLRSSMTPARPPPAGLPASPFHWAFFRLSRPAIPQIKAAASHKQDWGSSVAFISSNDAVSAFYWKRLGAVRVANGSVDLSAKSKFSRAIDIRAAVGCPPGYMGQMIYHAATELTYRELAAPETTLSAVAARLRASLNESANEWAVRSYATFLAGIPDKGALVYGGGLNPALDVGASSVSQLLTGTLDFGPLLGKPDLIRRPNMTPVGGLMYILPPDAGSGDTPVLVCLSERDLEGLRADAEWSAVTEYIG
uniref:Hfaza1E n=1 Tax=Hypoxylon fragiforme TaxID=63214 RepID=A0A7G6J4G6_9PEZI|nr:Hfaza1E [Hypoxylon fragiforme]